MEKKEKQKDKEKYITKSTAMKQYGFSEGWLTKLGPPDKLVSNPHYSSSPKMQLYIEARVVKFIEDNKQEFDEWLEKKSNLCRAQKISAKKKADKTVQWAQNVKIHTDIIPDNMIKTAIEYFDDMDLEYGNGKYKYRDRGDINFNGIVTYVRHQLTNYDYLWNSLKGMCGKQEAFDVLWERTRDKCAEMVCKKFGTEIIYSYKNKFESKNPGRKNLIDELVKKDDLFEKFKTGIRNYDGNFDYVDKEAYFIAHAIRVVKNNKATFKTSTEMIPK